MIRLLLTLIFLLLFFLVSLLIFPVESLIGKKHPERKDRSCMRIVQWALRVVFFLSGSRLTVKGRENIPTEEAVLYIGNHRGFFDIVCLYPLLPRPTGFMAKIELEKVPILSIWMKYIHCLFLDRQDIRQGLKTILAAIDLVKNGISVCIFPEGTRSRGTDQTELLPFHEGSFKVATKTDCCIVPFAITGTSAILEDHFPWIRRSNITVEFGKPFRPSELTREQKKGIGAYTRDIVCEMVRENI